MASGIREEMSKHSITLGWVTSSPPHLHSLPAGDRPQRPQRPQRPERPQRGEVGAVLDRQAEDRDADDQEVEAGPHGREVPEGEAR